MVLKTIFYLLFVFLSVTGNVFANEKNSLLKLGEFQITARNGMLSLHAKKASLKEVLTNIEKNVGIKTHLIGEIKDRKLSLNIDHLPVESLDTLLRKMELSNYSILYDLQHKNQIIYILAEGMDIREVIKGKAVIMQADFTKNINSHQVKGKEIHSFPQIGKNKDSIGIRYVEGELLLQFHNGVTKNQQDALLRTHGLKRIKVEASLAKLGYAKVSYPANKDINAIASALKNDRLVKELEPNYVAGIMTSADPYYSYQWHIGDTGFDQAWPKLTSNTPVKIAVLDTGVKSSHPDLAKKISAGQDFVNNDAQSDDDNGHGTFVAGIIAAVANEIGIKGLYENAQILPVKVMDANGLGTYESVALGILYAADAGARVINLSLGGYGRSSLLQDAVDYAVAKGVVIVAAGGNDGIELPLYPAACIDVIGVSALEKADKIWLDSNRGKHIDFAAPGANIISTGLADNYIIASGTSASPPMVAALAAMLQAEKPALPAPSIIRLLSQTAKDLGEAGWDTIYGYGKIDAAKALTASVASFHDVAVGKVSAEEQILDPGIPALLKAEILNIGSFASERCSVVFSKKVAGNTEEIGRVKDIEVLAKSEVAVTWQPGKSDNLVVFNVEAVCETDEDLTNNIKSSVPFTVSTKEGLVYIQHKSEPPMQVHQFLAGEGWELLRRYLTGKAMVLKIPANTLDNQNAAVADMVSQEEKDFPGTDTWDATNQSTVAPLTGKNPEGKNLMVEEFDDYIGERILFKVGRTAETISKRNGIADNFDSPEVPGFEDYDGEQGTINLTYSGKNESPDKTRSLPYSIYYSAFQNAGRRDKAFEDFIKENFPNETILPYFLSTGEIYSSEDRYENVVTIYGTFKGELDTYPNSGPLGNDDIIEGSHEMDVYDTSETHDHYNDNWDNVSNFYHHFWKPDTYDDNQFNDGLNTQPIGGDNPSAITVAEKLWKHALYYYRNGNKDLAYYYVGRIVHLLTDMGCPPHVHNDPHPISDSYEEVMGQVEANGTTVKKSDSKEGKSIYLKWNADNLKNELNASLGKGSRVSPNAIVGVKLSDGDIDKDKKLFITDAKILKFTEESKAYKEFSDTVKSGVDNISDAEVTSLWQNHTDLFRLFYSLAEIGDDFPSDTYSGDIVEEHHLGNESANSIIEYYAPIIQPAIIEHVAGLYKLFWESTHGTILGRAVDSSIEGVAGAIIEFYSDSNFTTLLATTVADAEGRFIFSGCDRIEPYFLKFSKDGYASLKVANGVSVGAGYSMDLGALTWPPSLTIMKKGTGSGTVTSNPSGIDCGTTCTAGFTKDASVTLTASASTGSTFSGWTGCNSESDNSCTVLMTSARTVTADYTALMEGDVDKSGAVDLADAIKSLQIVAGIPVAGRINIETDVNNDGRIGLEEALYALRPTFFINAFYLPDTGQTQSYTNIPGEDSDYIFHPQSYTKLNDAGSAIPINSTIENGWVATYDNNTGLMWEIKTNDGTIHDRDNFFTWYNTSDFINSLNQTKFCGFSDWRLPTILELMSIMNYGKLDPAVDSEFFPNIISPTSHVSRIYWSSDTNSTDSSKANAMAFINGWFGSHDKFYLKTQAFQVMAVRGTSSSTEFIDNGDGTITDKKTGLMWQKTNDGVLRTWAESLIYCENLLLAGHNDWRLPDIKESASIINFNTSNPNAPAIDTTYFETFFPSLPLVDRFWSSTIYVGDPATGWALSPRGNPQPSGGDPLDTKYNVRAVRNAY